MGSCRKCGCTDHDCTECVERTGRPCHWVEMDLCSACTPRFTVLDLVVCSMVAIPPMPNDWLYVVCEPGLFPVELFGPPRQHFLHVVELHLPAELYALARRVLPRMAEKGFIKQ
jgi:hypothetical protein